ncbi:lysoplasmalogenase [Ciceribacter sp. RN22]|uniref:lysoplasmalogenase family protein n=1 Tax=Ciceribacter sp. RN22 TaxID=2954932 RepID=UPI0020926E45|nr:lysoplasmalogenase [Ciceribacter sp. RN22]MCO6180240.1 lysoplasmalogenase [Ciceribacter sp. RN22]
MDIATGAWLLLSVVFGLSYLRLLNDPTSTLRTVVKTLPVLLLAGFAWSAEAPKLLLAALLLSAAGDAFLAHDGERAFVGGLAAFLLAHLMYGALFVSVAAPSIVLSEAWRIPAGAVSAVAIAIVLPLVRRYAGPHRMAVSVYGIIILGMALLALLVPAPTVFVGAAVFMSSDAVLAWRRFVLKSDGALRRAASYYVWISYFAAQCILTWALASVAAGL